MVKTLAVVIAATISPVAFAGNVKVSVDTRTFEVGQTIGLQVQVTDASPTAVPKVMVPEGFTIRYTGQRANSGWIRDQRTGVQKVLYYVQYEYEISASDVGSYTVGPVAVDLGTTTARGEPLAVEVIAAKPAPEAPLRISHSLDRATAWEGQVVVYSYRMEGEVEPLAASWTVPDWDGYRRPRDGDSPRSQYVIADPGGKKTRVDETFIPLVAAVSGPTHLDGATMIASFSAPDRAPEPLGQGSWRQVRKEVFVTPPIDAVITPLPPPPEGFSGLVGDFEIGGMPAASRATVGGSVVWPVVLSGNGILEGYALTSMDVPGARVYDDSPRADATLDTPEHQYLAKGVYKRTIVPTEAGTLDLPPLSIITFSPSKGVYETLTLDPPPIEVRPGGPTDPTLTSFKEPVPTLNVEDEDIDPFRASGADTAFRLGPWVGALMVPAGAPGVGALFVTLWRRMRDRKKVEAPPPRPLQHLPADPAARLARLDELLRGAASALAPSDPVQVRIASLRAEVASARFGGKPAQDLDARAITLLTELGVA